MGILPKFSSFGAIYVGPNSAIRSIVTETGTSPSVTAITLGATQNALRVFADLTAASEPFFYLYVKRNSDSVQKVKIYAWSARIFSGAVGDTFAFGTANGRTLSIAGLVVPAVLESSFPVTGTANADRGIPPYWSPSAAHVTLAGAGSTFRLVDDGTNGLVFIREYDGSVWTPPRWVRRQSGRATAVRCTYAQIALGTLDGSTLAIAAPTGAVIGGTSAAMSNSYMPVATGTTRNVTNVATLKTAIAAAVAGDEIVLAAGTYALDVAIISSTFTANNGVGGRTAAGGILIRGGTGNLADVIITGNGVSTNGNWFFDCDNVSFAGFKDLTFDFTGINAGFETRGGKIAYQDVRMFGISVSARDLFNAACINAASTIEALRITAEDAGLDCISGSGGGGFEAASRFRYVDCIARRAGSGSSANQCLTTHLGQTVEWYGGLLSDANTNAAAPDAITSPLRLFFASITKGAHDCGLVNCTLFGCDVPAGRNSSAIGAEGGALFSRLGLVPVAANNIFQNSVNRHEHNVLTSSTAAGGARAAFNLNTSGNTDGFRYNVITGGFDSGITCAFAGAAGGSTAIYGNTFVGCNVALRLDDADLIMASKNNACKTSGTGISCTATSMGHLTTNYNTIDPAIDADFVAGANDLVAGDAALDAFYFPTAAGNCDGNGDTALEDFIGDSDPWGYVRIYKSSRVSRGARDIPAIYASAVLQPDLF